MSSRSFRDDDALTVEEASAWLSGRGRQAVAGGSLALEARDVERVDRVLVGDGPAQVEVILALYGDASKAMTSSGALVSAVRQKYPDRPFQRFNYGRTVVIALGDSPGADEVLQILREEGA
jgi:hypothetical protein